MVNFVENLPLKDLPLVETGVLVGVINAVLLKHFLTRTRKENIVIAPKVDKGRNLPGYCHPISLLSNLSKVRESIIAEKQFSFRAGLSIISIIGSHQDWILQQGGDRGDISDLRICVQHRPAPRSIL